MGSDDIAVTAGADIVVVTAGAKQKPGQTRLELAGVNVEMCRRLIPQLVERPPDAIVLMVTNPVDVLTYAAQKFSGLPKERVFGSGTVLDSSRLRILLARHAGVAVQSVHAYVVGEHGDSELPLWSTATIGPIPVADWSVPGVPPLDAAVRDGIAHQVVTAAERIIRGKGATNYAIGLSTARISRRSSRTRSASCRSRRCSTASTGCTTCACRCRRWWTGAGSSRFSRRRSATTSRPR